jgi:hypothetical protein
MTYIGTSKYKWIYWTSPHYEFLIDMLSKLSRYLKSEIRGSSSMQICNNISMEKVALSHIPRDRERKGKCKRSSPNYRKVRVMGT